jgi:hypothetical protein
MSEFIVSLTDLEYPSEPITSDAVRNSLVYGGFGRHVRVQVRKYDPASEERIRKIPAIKRIRNLLVCSLKDAKFLTDVAERIGESNWSTVKVTHDGTEDGYRVIDNS